MRRAAASFPGVLAKPYANGRGAAREIMVKLVNTSVPPDLVEAFNALVSPQKKGATGATKNRTRRGAKRPRKKKPRNIELLLLMDSARALAIKLGINPDTPAGGAFIYDESRRLILGVFNENWWQPIPRIASKTLISNPTSAPDGDPPPYDYREADRLPTIATYPDGSASTGKAAYAGAMNGIYFKDTFLKWRRLTYQFSNPKAPASEMPMVMSWLARIDIAASNRASKPMLSLQLQAYHGNAAIGFAVSLAAPVTKRTNYYWRFAIPPSVPPYYNAYQVRRITRALNGRIKSDGTTPDTSITLTASPRPMLGRGYNNNDTVSTVVTGDPAIYSFSPCLGEPQMILCKGRIGSVNYDAILWDPITGETTPLLGSLGYASYRAANCYFMASDFAAHYPRWNVRGEYCGTFRDMLSEAGQTVIWANTGKGFLVEGAWLNQAGAYAEAGGLPYGLNRTTSGPGDLFVAGGANPSGNNQFFSRCGEAQAYDYATPGTTFSNACIAGNLAYGFRTNGDIWVRQIRNADGSWINDGSWDSYSGINPEWANITDWDDKIVFKNTTQIWQILDSEGNLTNANMGGMTVFNLWGTMCRNNNT